MPDPDFECLERQLARDGYSRAAIARMTMEMREHFEDMVENSRSRGLGDAESRLQACREFGSIADLARVARHCRERSHWAYRYPRFARCVLPAATAVLPSLATDRVPRDAKTALARWSLIIAAGAAIAAGHIIAMQLAITLT